MLAAWRAQVWPAAARGAEQLIKPQASSQALQPARQGSSAFSRTQQLAQKVRGAAALQEPGQQQSLRAASRAAQVALKIAPQRREAIRAFWRQERGVVDAALLWRAHRLSGAYPRYRDLRYLEAQLRVSPRQCAGARASQQAVRGASAVQPLRAQRLHREGLAARQLGSPSWAAHAGPSARMRRTGPRAACGQPCLLETFASPDAARLLACTAKSPCVRPGCSQTAMRVCRPGMR